ncbi:MAG TPA: DUF3662 and FHA domain-containing protein [Actinomycetota bacterium]|nr:DUF3662 and FHA domain-containing protein [Actinomycetota bacterium]
MSILAGFEQRLERAVEGFFARIFRSGVHPLEIGKRIQRVMEDGRKVALRRTYVPNVYRIQLSKKDYERLAPMESKIVEELEIFVGEAARQREWVLADTPRVSFTAGDLSPGEFRVETEPVVLDRDRDRTRRPAARKDPQRRPAAPGRPSLVVLGDRGPERTIPVDARIRIGRLADNDLVLPDPEISRHHAEVVDDSGNGMYVVRDLGSKNGTMVNGEKVDQHRLRDGDRIVVGHTVLEFRRS